LTLTSLLTGTVGSLLNRVPAKITRVVSKELPELQNVPPDVRRLIRDHRHCKILTEDEGLAFDEASIDCAWKSLQQEMALIPGGEVSLTRIHATSDRYQMKFEPNGNDLIAVQTNYMDRTPITNDDFAKFVAAGGYDNMDLWPVEVIPKVLQFVDQTGNQGPKFWENGQPPTGQLAHPVVGVCWYEANAYASWASKRLPMSAEWQRAGTWFKSSSGDDAELRYPWGNAFNPSKANTWAAHLSATVAVDEFPEGRTPNGVSHLIGNVWEWVDTEFTLDASSNARLNSSQFLAEIRGGAFDTYFHSQVTNQYRSGQPLFYRSANVGFRCCVSEDRLTQPNGSHNPTQDEANE